MASRIRVLMLSPDTRTVVNAGGSDVIRPRIRANYSSGREPQEEGEGKERLYEGMCRMKCVYVRVICSLHNYKIFLPWPNTTKSLSLPPNAGRVRWIRLPACAEPMFSGSPKVVIGGDDRSRKISQWKHVLSLINNK